MIEAFREEVEDSSNRVREETNIDNLSLIRTTASALLRHRTNEVLRTGFSVAMFIFQVVSAFAPSAGASSSPSGRKIGTECSFPGSCLWSC